MISNKNKNLVNFSACSKTMGAMEIKRKGRSVGCVGKYHFKLGIFIKKVILVQQHGGSEGIKHTQWTGLVGLEQMSRVGKEMISVG